MAIGKFLAPLNKEVLAQPTKPYVDDIFDPLFNRDVVNYYNTVYGNRPMGIAVGYADMIDNALLGHRGMLGPGMGILSTFGRSMDKADDFILGFLTEGTNALGTLTGGSGPAPVNPIENIFANDYDYQGTKLMAAAGNAMSKLAGAEGVRLDESDFTTIGDRIAGTTLDLTTDPGIAGGQLARLNPNTAVGNVGRIMSNYDDIMSNVAGNMAFPGGKYMLHETLERIRDALGSASSAAFKDIVTNPEEPTKFMDPEYSKYTDNLTKMSDDLVYTYDINPIDDPETYKIYEDIKSYTATPVEALENDVVTKYTLTKEKLSNFIERERSNIRKSAFEGVEKYPHYFTGRKIISENSDDIFKINNIETLDDAKDFLYEKASTKADFEYLDYLESRDVPLEDIKDYLNRKYATTSSTVKPRYIFRPNKAGFQSTVAKSQTDFLDYHMAKFLKKHPDGFKTLNLRNEFGENMYIPNDSFWTTLYHYGNRTTPIGMSKAFKGDSLSLKKVLDAFTNENGLYNWATRNADTLSETQYGRDLLEFINGVNEDVIKLTNYDDILNNAMDEMSNISVYKLLNENFNKQTEFTAQELADFKEHFKYFDIIDTRTNKIIAEADTSLYKYTAPTPHGAALNVEKLINSAEDMPNLTHFNKYVSDLKPVDFAKTVTNTHIIQDGVLEDVTDYALKDFKYNWGLENIPSDELEHYIRTFGNRHEQTLFAQIRAATTSKIRNKTKTGFGALNTRFAKRSKELINKIINSKKYTDSHITEYIARKDLASDIVVNGDNFLESLWASGGFKEMPFYVDSEKGLEAYNNVKKALQSNIDKINKHGDILVLAETTEGNTKRLAIAFNTKNLKIKKNIHNLYGLFGKKDLGLEDVMFRQGKLTTTSFNSSELEEAINATRQGTEALSTTLGYTKFDPNYIPHVMKEDSAAAEYFSNMYKSLGINKNELDDLCSALQQEDIASGRLQFGTIPMERSHLGHFGQYYSLDDAGHKHNVFSTDLAAIHDAAYTQGMLDNTNAQTFYDLFLTDNFKINKNFKDVETLKKALFMQDDAGKYTGNLNNLSLVKPRWNEHGKLIGFTRFDKFSDAALEKAFNDSEAVLLPDQTWVALDRLCKKNARMSNKVYAFINHYLTVPFKFGTLANAGFLVGNIEDAYFKQAVELSKKYGTTMEEELSNVAFSMRHVITLNNQFDEVLDGYRQFLKTDEAKASDIFRKYTSDKAVITADLITNNPEASKAWLEYLNKHLPSDVTLSSGANALQVSRLYMYLNNFQNTALFNNNNLDLEDVIDTINKNKYNIPNNAVERLFYGDPTKGKGSFRSWGLFVNNPVSNKILKSSNQIETLMRSSAMLNDLEHKGFSKEKIMDILALPKDIEAKAYNDLHISMTEAVNTMSAANFDYDNVTELMNKASYILPFPTFYLKNLAFWADIFTNKPQLIDNVISTHEGMWAGKKTDKDEFMAEAKGRGAVPIGTGKKHLTGIVKQSPYNSMFGAFNAVNNFKEDFAYRTNPVLRPVTHHLQDPKDVKYRPYSFNQYEKNHVKGDKNFSNLSYMFHQLNPYERTINTYIRTPGKIANNDYQLNDFLPSIFQPDFSKK